MSPPTVVTATVVTVRVSPLLAPTWKVCAPAPAPTIAAPLNLVCVAMRVISADSCWYSVSRLARSPAPFEPFCACTASSRMRCRASVTVASAPSAVCASEMPSLALRIATFVPRICAFMRSAIARPAASSFDELTRRPDESRSIDVASDDCEVLRLRCALSETMLELMVCGMRALLTGTRASGNDAGIGRAVVSACATFLSPRFGRGPAKRRRFDPSIRRP